MEPPVTESRNQRSKIPDEWQASIGLLGAETYPIHRSKRGEERRMRR
jgi:hypothetical protein